MGELPAPSNGGLILPQMVGVEGGLMIARGGNLWLAWFGGGDPALIAEGICARHGRTVA